MESVRPKITLNKNFYECETETIDFEIKSLKMTLYFRWKTEDQSLRLHIKNKEENKLVTCNVDGYLDSRRTARKLLFREEPIRLMPGGGDAIVHLGHHRLFLKHCFSKRDEKNEKIRRTHAEFIFQFTKKCIEEIKKEEAGNEGETKKKEEVGKKEEAAKQSKENSKEKNDDDGEESPSSSRVSAPPPPLESSF